MVSPSSVVKNLGCWLDGQLKRNEHINRVCKASFFNLYNIRRIRKFLSSDCKQILVNAFVTSHLDYCNSLLLGLPNNKLHKLQRVRNEAARLICNVGRFDHITPSLHSFHWLPVTYRIQFKILLFICKAIHGLAQEYISELVDVKTSSKHNLRSSNDKHLLEHLTIKSKVTLGDRCFAVAAPLLILIIFLVLCGMLRIYRVLNACLKVKHAFLKRHITVKPSSMDGLFYI